jgi:hypothetical protein
MLSSGRPFVQQFRSLAVLTLLILSPACSRLQNKLTAEHTVLMSLCDVVQNWQSFHGKPIRAKAILSVGLENSSLSHPQCSSDEYSTYPDFSHLRVSWPKKLEGLISRDRRAWVVVTGTYFGPEPRKVDQTLPEPLRTVLQSAPQRYGHLGMMNNQVDVFSINVLGRVPNGLPW